MAVPDETREELADALYDALRTKSPIGRLTAEHDLSMADAYDIQTRFIDRRLDDGAETVGHKIGLTSDGIQEQLGVDEPDYGRLLDTMFVEGREIPGEDLIQPRIEPEIGFVMEEPLEPPVTY